MSDIRLGVVAGKSMQVTTLGNISALWKGPLLLDNSQTAPNCWIKAVTLPELVLECYGHLLAREAGLPFLAPIVVTDPSSLLGHPSEFFFATEDAASPSLRQLVTMHPAPMHSTLLGIYAAALQQWKESPTLAVLDELIANGDRNIGNLLFDGRSKWIPIDYSRAKATGPAPNPSWDGSDVSLGKVCANHLIDFFKVLNNGNVYEALDRINNSQLYLGVLQHFVGLPIQGCEQLAQKLTVWIQDRREWALRRLLGNRLSAGAGPSGVLAL